MDKSGFVIVKQGHHQVGLQDKNGKEILSCIYDKILDYDEDGYVRFIKDGVYGTVNFKGEICIPLSLGISHLGVFHVGTARARKGNLWGLVNSQGETVGTFDYQKIDAFVYHLQAYKACNAKGKNGILYPDGSFKPDKNELDVPVCHATLSYSLYDLDWFTYRVKSFIGQYHPRLHFYYRDTDAAINVKKLYKKGRIIHNDRFLVADEKLLKPIYKTRFLIMSTGFIPYERYEREFLTDRQASGDFYSRKTSENLRENIKNKGVVIPPNTYFIVKDVVTYAGVTQVLLLHIPYHAIEISKKLGVNLSSFRAETEDYIPIGKAALADLQEKSGGMVYGHSLSADWCEKMYHPVGCNDQFCLNDLEPVPTTAFTKEQSHFLSWWQTESKDDCNTWNNASSKKEQPNPIYLYSGDCLLMSGDALVWPADKVLPDAVTKFKCVIRAVVPYWHDDKNVKKELALCYRSVLDNVIKNHLDSVVLPLLGTDDYGFKLETVAEVAVETLFKVLEEGKCKADIYVCCKNDEEVQAFIDGKKKMN